MYQGHACVQIIHKPVTSLEKRCDKISINETTEIHLKAFQFSICLNNFLHQTAILRQFSFAKRFDKMITLLLQANIFYTPSKPMFSINSPLAVFTMSVSICP